MPDIIITLAVVASSAGGIALLALHLSRGKPKQTLVVWGSLGALAWMSLWLAVAQRPHGLPFADDTTAGCTGVGGADVDLPLSTTSPSSVMVPSAFLGGTAEVAPTARGFTLTSGDNHVDVDLEGGTAKGGGTFYVCEPDGNEPLPTETQP